MDKIGLIALKKSGAPDISAAVAAKEAAQAAQEAAETAQGKAEDAAEELEDALEDIAELQSDVSTLQEDTSDLKSRISATEIVVQSDFQPIVQIADGSANNAKSYDVQIVPQQAGSGDPSPENVRPITGFTGATVTRVRNNLLPMPITSGSYENSVTITVNDDLSFYINKPNGNGWTTFVIGEFLLKAGGYTIIEDDDSNTNASMSVYKNDTEIVNTRWGKRQTFSLTEDTVVKITFARAASATNVLTKLMLFSGTAATANDYEPYQGEDYAISFPSSAGTVYGGSLHVNEDGSGTLTVDRTKYTPTGNEANYARHTVSVSFALPTNIRKAGNNDVICSDFVVSSNGTYCYVTTDMSVDELKSYFSNHTVDMVCWLTTPETYTITAPQIALLLGTNNIWSDTGDMVVEYIADTKLYIQQLTGYPDEDMTADANITSGSFFMIGNTLYLATANIANGSTVVPGTNCTQMSLAAALNSINA